MGGVCIISVLFETEKYASPLCWMLYRIKIPQIQTIFKTPCTKKIFFVSKVVNMIKFCIRSLLAVQSTLFRVFTRLTVKMNS